MPTARMVIRLCAITCIAVCPAAAQAQSQAVDPPAQDAPHVVRFGVGQDTGLALECRECLARGAFGSTTNNRPGPVRAIQSVPSHRARNIVIGAIVGAVVGGTIGERVGQRSVDDLCSGRDCSGPRLTPLYDAAYGAAIGAIVGGLVGWVWPRPAT
jgi:hypothetical protein